MGFCVYNNVAVAAAEARRSWGARRVLVVDWDVHHGDGTQSAFYADPRVLVVSVHRHDGGAFYPGTGAAAAVGDGPGAGYNVNVPLDGRWFGDADYAAVFDAVVCPLGRAFRPDVVLVAAGWDAARGDFLGDFDVTPAGYAALTHALVALGAPVVLACEGGYNLRAVAASVAACARVLLGGAPPRAPRSVNAVRDADEAGAPAPRVGAAGAGSSAGAVGGAGSKRAGFLDANAVPREATWAAIRAVAAAHAAYWPVLAPLIGAAPPGQGATA